MRRPRFGMLRCAPRTSSHIRGHDALVISCLHTGQVRCSPSQRSMHPRSGPGSIARHIIGCQCTQDTRVPKACR